jgi:hypothetical protein
VKNENLQIAFKIKNTQNYIKKKCLIVRIGGKMHYLQSITIFFCQNFSNIHQIDKKKLYLMIFNDKPNGQVLRILMNPRSIHVRMLRE